MLRLFCLTCALLLGSGSLARACDGAVSVAPSVVVDNAVYAPLAVAVAPVAAVTPLSVEVHALHVAPFQVRVLSSARANACVAPRLRPLARPARTRVSVRLR